MRSIAIFSRRLMLAGLTLGLASGAWAGSYPSRSGIEFTDYAKVISSTPVYEEFNEPSRECWTERAGYDYETRSDHSYGGAVVGTIVGGLLGHQVGKGKGRTVATAVGAATGAIIGDNIDNDGYRTTTYRQPREVERCATRDNWSRRVTGYDVVYRYQGQDYTTFLPYDPGSSLRMNVRASVDEHR